MEEEEEGNDESDEFRPRSGFVVRRKDSIIVKTKQKEKLVGIQGYGAKFFNFVYCCVKHWRELVCLNRQTL